MSREWIHLVYGNTKVDKTVETIIYHEPGSNAGITKYQAFTVSKDKQASVTNENYPSTFIKTNFNFLDMYRRQTA